MRIEELRRIARETFGQNLEHATPANVREFLDGLQQARWQAERSERIAQTGRPDVLDLTEASDAGDLKTWESHMRGFFNRALDRSPERAAAGLWLFALEMAYSGIEELNAERFGRLFQDDA